MIYMEKNGVVTVREMTTEEKDKQIELARFDARCREASAIRHAKDVEREKWERFVVELDITLSEKETEIAALRAKLKERGLTDG